ncbi:cytochrome P450 [Mycena belliarum]|uniref:Cytochrome P450 n=1 Tax=Mycena belliarum TaxID=1033014 RepID=A0AAD6XWR1_9AGAR|nr:cytochrome P450 [Mycena belliae]
MVLLSPSLVMPSRTVLFICGSLLVAWLCFKFISRHSHPLPPGPRKLPVIGNILSIPRAYQWMKFAKWAKHYNSDIIHLDVFGSSIVVLCSYDAVVDLLDKRSSIYSNRPQLLMATELMGWKNSIFLKQYGESWRAGRRLLHEQFQPTAVTRFKPQQTVASHHLMQRLLNSPVDFSAHIRYAASDLSMSIAYGMDVVPAHVKVATATLAAVAVASSPGAYFVDFIPMLKHAPEWFPGASFLRNGRKWKQDYENVVNEPFTQTQQALVDGLAAPSFTQEVLETLNAREDNVSQNDFLKFAAADIYMGAVDTSVSAITAFFLAMLLNPQAMRKAQAELDAVIKPGFLPSFEDEPRLPYISAIVLETLRWHVVNPLAIPHAATEDDVYRGYRIPASSIVIANVWAITHDENKYQDPFEFRPERYLTKEGVLDPTVQDPRSVVFGFGRRACPGMHLGTSFVWITVASVLSCFNITKALDKNGVATEPSYEQSSGLVSFPKPFKCSIAPRSPDAAKLIKETTDV